jgi:V-type H+-transporting ATPase subunit A
VTIVGAVSPPRGDFSDPETIAAIPVVQMLWGLDKKLAQRKHFPSVNWLKSYTKYERALEPFYERVDTEFVSLRTKCHEILQQEDALSEIVQLVGKDSLDESGKVTLDVAKMIREDFLQQNSYTDYDRYCPLWKTISMIRNIITFHDLAQSAVSRGDAEHKVTFGAVKQHMTDLIAKLSMMKMRNVAKQTEEEGKKYFQELYEETLAAFASLSV